MKYKEGEIELVTAGTTGVEENRKRLAKKLIVSLYTVGILREGITPDQLVEATLFADDILQYHEDFVKIDEKAKNLQRLIDADN